MTISQSLGVLTEVTDLRSVWPNEASDFTPWLAKPANLKLLSDAVGLDLTADETESGVGDFSVDILATEMGSGARVVIENQLEDTNHDHLGKLITYASGKDASIIIWVVKRAREEHKSAIAWLNAHTDDGAVFFLCEVKLYRIGDSKPAVMFDVVERPNDWAREQKQASQAVSETMNERKEWWQAFNDYAYEDAAFKKQFNKRKPSTDHWMSLYIGSSLCHIELLQQRRDGQLGVELRIPDSKQLYAHLLEHKEEIEEATGESLTWMELPDQKASRILAFHDIDYASIEERPDQFQWAMRVALGFKKSVVPLVKKIG